MCDHLHEQSSRYDRTTKVLTFLLVCPDCRTEKAVETLPYEPRFKPCLIPNRDRAAVLPVPATKPLAIAA